MGQKVPCITLLALLRQATPSMQGVSGLKRRRNHQNGIVAVRFYLPYCFLVRGEGREGGKEGGMKGGIEKPSVWNYSSLLDFINSIVLWQEEKGGREREICKGG